MDNDTNASKIISTSYRGIYQPNNRETREVNNNIGNIRN
jgi:hypothetical protein